MNLSLSVLSLQRPITAYALAQGTHTYSLFPLSSLPPSCTQTGHCVRAQMRFACMLDWITHAASGNLDPCGLPPLLGPEHWGALLSIYNFKQISQLNWLRNTQNQRLNSLMRENGRQSSGASFAAAPAGTSRKIDCA